MTLVGIDVGTTWCKAALVTEDGREIAHHRVHTPWNQVASGAEIEPARLLTAALEACAGALAAAPTAAVAGVGVTSMAETGVLIDAGGEPVANAIAWHDQRGTEEMRVLTPALGGATRFGQVTGLPPSPLCTLAKYAWLRERAPASADGVRWLNVAEWVVRSLGGEELADLSLASRTGMLDLDRAAPWDQALDAARAPRDLLPELAPSGTPAGRVSRGLEQAEGAILCTAGHDHLCAAIGAGATGDDDVFDSCGTAEALIRALPPSSSARLRPRALAAEVTVGWHALPGRHALLAAFLGGLALRRLGALLGAADDGSRHALEAGAADAEAAGSGAAVLAATEHRGAAERGRSSRGVARRARGASGHGSHETGPIGLAGRPAPTRDRGGRWRAQRCCAGRPAPGVWAEPPRKARRGRGRRPRSRAAGGRGGRRVRRREELADTRAGTGGDAMTDVNGEPLLEARAIELSYGRVQALRGADFAVRAGEVVALVGDNGAGKSTLVKILSGTLRPDAGEILFEGRPVSLRSPHEARDLGIETVYQDLAVAPDLDPAANLFLGRERTLAGPLGRLGFLDRRAMRREADEAFASLGVELQDTDVSVASLSGGQRQGVAVSRAVTWASRVVFMDEPTAALGVVQSRNVYELIRKVRSSGLAVVLISHNLPEVFEVADRIEVMRLGRRVARFEATGTSMDEIVAAMTGASERDEEDS